MNLSPKTTSRRVLNGKIREQKQANENMEAMVYCLMASIHKKFPVIHESNCKDGDNFLPLFGIDGYGVLGLFENSVAISVSELKLKHKINNLRNGYKANGFARTSK
jgi:hypothetical protein